MNFCASIQQPKYILEEVQEIIVDYNEISKIYDIMQEFQNKRFNIKLPKTIEVIQLDDIISLNKALNIVVALGTLDNDLIKQCKENNIKFYWGYPVSSYEEVYDLKNLGVSEILIDGILYFDLDRMKTKNIPLRAVANKCKSDLIPFTSGICGTYIRPEDVKYYEDYIDTLEFFTSDLLQEKAYLQIYQHDQFWPGNLNLLLINLNKNVDNRGFESDFAESRLNCRQKCLREGGCLLCYNMFRYIEDIQKIRPDEWDPEKGFKNS